MDGKAELINYANSEKYRSICRRLCKKLSPELANDLFQEFILALLEKTEQQISEIKSRDAYLYRILTNMACSSTSKFYNQYRKDIYRVNFYDGYKRQSQHDAIELKRVHINNVLFPSWGNTHNKKFQHAFDSLYWYDREVLKLYTQYGSAASVAEKVNIPYKSLQRTIAKAKQEIKKRMAQFPIKVLLPVQYNVTGLDYHRLLMPFERLQKTHGEIYDIKMLRGTTHNNTVFEPPLADLTDEQLKQFDVVYILRQVSHDITKIQPTIDKIKANGLKIIFDIDDYWKLPKEHFWHKKYKEQKVEDGVIATLKQADAVTTTTSTFADIIKEYNQNVTVLPNCISPDDIQFKQVSISSPRLRFGWIGGVFHRPDIKILESSIKRLYESPELKDKWQLCFGGYNPNPEFKEIEKIFTVDYCFKNYDKAYYTYLMQQTPAMEHIAFDKPYRRLWGRDVKTYGQIYNDVDVCLVPLVKNTFNECKSELKIVEAGTMGKAVICSDVRPYNQWIVDGVNGILIKPERNYIDWFVAIRKLILNPELVKQMGAELQKTIKENFNMDEHNKRRNYLITSVVL